MAGYPSDGGGYEHRMQDLPPAGAYHRSPQDDIDGQQPLLHDRNQQFSPLENNNLRAGTPPMRPSSTYSLTETYAVSRGAPVPYSSDYGAAPAYGNQLEDNPYVRSTSPYPRASLETVATRGVSSLSLY